MGSLKRKNASLPASATSNKRASREDNSYGVTSNGYSSRRGGHSSSSSTAAVNTVVTPTPDPLANGNAPPTIAAGDPLHSSASPDKQTTEIAKDSDKDSASPSDVAKEQESEGTCRSDTTNLKNLGPLIPNHAGWFSWNSIHPIEQRGLPEFFNSKSKVKTPILYLEYRNMLMKKYLENPEKLFTLADVPSTIPDNREVHIEAAKRIFAFLDFWGLINSRALCNSEVDKAIKPKTSTADEKNCTNEEKASTAEEKDSTAEEKASAAEGKAPNAEAKTSDAEGKSSTVEVKSSSDTEMKSSVSEATAEGKYPTSEEKISSTDGKPSTSEVKPSTAEGKTCTASEGKISTAEGRTPASEGKTSTAEGRTPASEGKTSAVEKRTSSVEGKCSELPITSSVSSLYRFDSPSVASSSKNSTKFPVVLPASTITESTVADLQGGLQGTSVEYHCNSCSADCSKRRFHCQKQADFDLCPECYNDGKFSYGITSTDFILMEAVTDANDSNGWSDQETLLLLEALELYGDNFSEIAEHVGTKTKAQCILHFIRLPIEDPFLDAMESDNTANVQQSTDAATGSKSSTQSEEQEKVNETDQEEKTVEEKDPTSDNANQSESLGDGEVEDKASSATSALLSAAQAAGLVGHDKSISFSECGNPVMALVSFLAALVSPDIAAISAQNALKILAEQASALQLADQNSFNLEFEPSADDESTILEEREPAEKAVQSDTQPEMQSASDECDEKMKEATDSGAEKVKDSTDVGADKATFTDEGNAQAEGVKDLTKCSSIEKIKNAAATALAAAAVKAKFLADQEEWEILRCTALVVDTQAKKIEAKLKLFRDLDMAIEKEHNMLERSKQRILAERSQIASNRNNNMLVPPGHYISPNTSAASGPRMPHPMPRPSSGFPSAHPAQAAQFMMYGQNEAFRGFNMPHVNDAQGVNRMPMRPVQFNNAPQY